MNGQTLSTYLIDENASTICFTTRDREDPLEPYARKEARTSRAIVAIPGNAPDRYGTALRFDSVDAIDALMAELADARALLLSGDETGGDR